VALSECVGRELPIPTPTCAALLLRVERGFIQAHRTFRQTRNTEEAEAAFLAIADKEHRLKAAMACTPYADNHLALLSWQDQR